MPLFADLDRLRADLDALRPLAPEQEARVLQKFRLEWNYNSNAIEGNSLTLGETRSLLLHGVAASGKSIRDHDDIRNHNKVVAEVELLSTETRPVTEHLIREMHEILLGREPYYVDARTADGTPTRQLIQPGTYKRNPNQALTATGERIFFASPEETPAEMTELLAWYREQEEAAPTLHPVALAAEFHYRFVRIHPFDDGNGRMSRLLMNLILLRHGYPMTVIQAADRNRYLAALAEADAGEPEPFLRFIIENVEASLRLMIRAARGESIDEPSDLDKKLALLKKQLNRPLVDKRYWNLATRAQTWEALLLPWLRDLDNQLLRFHEFFPNYSIRVGSYASGNALLLDEDKLIFYNKISNLSEAIEHGISMAIGSTVLFDKLYFEFNLTGLTVLNKILNLSLRIRFVFTIYSWDAFCQIAEVSNIYKTSWEKLASSIYEDDYHSLHIDEINYQLANKVYDFIAAKLAEADAPPA